MELEKVKEKTLSTTAKTPKSCSKQCQSTQIGDEVVEKMDKNEEPRSV